MEGDLRLRLEILVRRLKVISYVLFNAVQFAASLIAIFATSLMVAVVAWFGGEQQRPWVLPLFSFALGVLFTMSLVVISYLRASPPRWLARGYRWVKAEYLYRIHEEDPKHHTQLITIEIEAIRPGVDHFENRYRWTAQGTEHDPELLNENQRLMGPPIQHAGWKYYYIHFGHELAVGERIEIKIRQELNERKNLETVLGKVVAEPLEELILRVALPKNRPRKQVWNNELSGPPPIGILVGQRGKNNYDPESGEVIPWVIRSPTFGHLYEIRWEQ